LGKIIAVLPCIPDGNYSTAAARNQRALRAARRKRLTGGDLTGYGLGFRVGDDMVIAPLFGTALLLAVATDPRHDSAAGEANLSAQEKRAATEPLVHSATQCIVRAVVADPRSGGKAGSALGDLIVDSMPACLAPLRMMIDAYDRYYGEGAGEAFFMGPYLDALPRAVVAGAKNAAQ
jgi:hypothetical protein